MQGNGAGEHDVIDEAVVDHHVADFSAKLTLGSQRTFEPAAIDRAEVQEHLSEHLAGHTMARLCKGGTTMSALCLGPDFR